MDGLPFSFSSSGMSLVSRAFGAGEDFFSFFCSDIVVRTGREPELFTFPPNRENIPPPGGFSSASSFSSSVAAIVSSLTVEFCLGLRNPKKFLFLGVFSSSTILSASATSSFALSSLPEPKISRRFKLFRWGSGSSIVLLITSVPLLPSALSSSSSSVFDSLGSAKILANISPQVSSVLSLPLLRTIVPLASLLPTSPLPLGMICVPKLDPSTLVSASEND
mmetsp:Transcript_26576/g.56961  ORF Transcript_26576/g.56961 Transcript_26576/m.56961 type:complete len:221 (+) Transcript_26576:900-1562(+)